MTKQELYMVMSLYSIYYCGSKSFGPPFEAKNHGEALIKFRRLFVDMEDGSEKNYELYYLADFDNDTGTIGCEGRFDTFKARKVNPFEADTCLDEPCVSLDTLLCLEAIERDKAVDSFMRRHGFTEAEDFSYGESDGERRLLLSRKAVERIKSHDSLRKEFGETLEAASLKALENGATIIGLQEFMRSKN
jgi:hypothetical protein